MTVPYDRIKSRIDYREIPCLLCDVIALHSVIDHCHEHGWTRGVLCVGCNNRMARVDADLRIATPAELFHRDNCPGCRREGFAGVSRRLATPQPAVTRTAKRVARHGTKAKRLRATLLDLEAACRMHAATVGVAPESLTRGQIKEAARAGGYSVSSDRVTRLAALLRGSTNVSGPDVPPLPSGPETPSHSQPPVEFTSEIHTLPRRENRTDLQDLSAHDSSRPEFTPPVKTGRSHR